MLVAITAGIFLKINKQLKKNTQNLALSGAPTLSAVPALSGGPTTPNSLFCDSTVT